MALDIAAGRRWPIFFDGQRYMGAVEAYTAAVFVAVFGHSPTIVAFAPLLYFGLFAAGQFVLWRGWADRTTGHLAALFTIICAPMFALWSIVPRGGYIEILAWALPVLGIYRRLTRPEAPALARTGQFGWGFLLTFGFFLNPLSLIVYLTLAIDWTIGRHGADIRRERRVDGRWIDSRWSPAIWLAAFAAAVVFLGACCHVRFDQAKARSPFIVAFNLLPTIPGAIVAAAGALGLCGLIAWWTGAVRRLVQCLAAHPLFTAGAILAFSPSLLHNILVARGAVPWDPSLPIWIRPPWDLGPNLRDGLKAMGPLLGCDPDAAATLLRSQGVALPPHVWPAVTQGLRWLSPAVSALVLTLVFLVAWRDRDAWRRVWALRGAEPTPPTALALLGLLVATTLYLLQATSPNGSSIRYLVPVWIVLPGLVASGLCMLRVRARCLAAGVLLLAWGTAQLNLWAEINRPSPVRPLVHELQRRGITAIVAQTPAALVVANLSSGAVGAQEYHPFWPRLRERYGARFVPGQPVICVADLDFPWDEGGSFGWSPRQDLARALRALASEYPGRVRMVCRIDHFEVWEVDWELSQPFREASAPLLLEPSSATLAQPSNQPR